MNSLVIYDSTYGNTRIVAEAIAKELGDNTKVVSVAEINIEEDFKGLSLIIAGSPINGWRPSVNMGKFLSNLRSSQLKDIKVTSFDTRINIFFHGDAANKISTQLTKAGGILITPPESFFVKGRVGPLVEGEIEKATKWATLIKNRSQAD